MRICSVILLLVTFGLASSCSDDTSERVTPPQAPQLMPTPIDRLLAFSAQEINTTRERPIVFVNGGSDALAISAVELSEYQGSGAAETFAIDVSAIPASISYNEALSLPVTFAPTVVGVHRAKVTVTSNSANLPVAEFELVGYAAASPLAAAPYLAFFPGDGKVITTDAGTFALVRFTNLGAEELTIYSYAIGGADAAAFSFPDGATVPSADCAIATCGASTPSGCLPVRVGYGVTVALGLPYAPTVAGVHTASFSVVSNASNCPTQLALTSE